MTKGIQKKFNKDHKIDWVDASSIGINILGVGEIQTKNRDM